MTQEEKARSYDEALERAKSFQQKFGGDYAGYIFHELRESEDKWFIKELQGFLESYGADYFGTGEWQKFHDWLEKHKEQNGEDINWLKFLRPSSWKSKLLKEAVEGRIHVGFHNAIYIKEPEWTEKLDKYEEGDKVLVIVLPKEDQTNG